MLKAKEKLNFKDFVNEYSVQRKGMDYKDFASVGISPFSIIDKLSQELCYLLRREYNREKLRREYNQKKLTAEEFKELIKKGVFLNYCNIFVTKVYKKSVYKYERDRTDEIARRWEKDSYPVSHRYSSINYGDYYFTHKAPMPIVTSHQNGGRIFLQLNEADNAEREAQRLKSYRERAEEARRNEEKSPDYGLREDDKKVLPQTIIESYLNS